MIIRRPTTTTIAPVPRLILIQPKDLTFWGSTRLKLLKYYLEIVAHLVYFFRLFGMRWTANSLAALLAEPRINFRSFKWLRYGKQKEFYYFGLNPTSIPKENQKLPAVLLLHGKGVNQSVWMELASIFQKKGIKNVFTLNSRKGELTDEDIPLFEEKLKEICGLYDAQRPEVIVIGHSRGAELSLYAGLPPDTFKLEKGYCIQLKKWERFRPEIKMMIRLGSPLLRQERGQLTDEMLGKIYEIDGLRDLIIPDRSLDPYYQADCGHVELLYNQDVHEKIVQLVLG